jgi:protein-tyrosine phosphatase
MKILFVCLGNICRSPIAQGVAQKIVTKKSLAWSVDSAGTSSFHQGEPPCKDSIKVARLNDIDISKQRSRPLMLSDFEAFDYIIALDDSNLSNIKKLQNSPKVLKLGRFGLDGKDVPDPYGYSDFAGFEKVFAMIEQCVATLFEDLAEKGVLGR